MECPSCGEPVALAVDTSAGARQSYVEDCPVCCRPMQVQVVCQPGSVLAIDVRAD